MAQSNYDANLQLALATSAEAEGDLAGALAFLAQAHVEAHDDPETHARVHWLAARFHARHKQPISAMKQISLCMLASAM